MLSEFARDIAQKEQPINMDNCLSFVQLVIWGCGQPLYKRFHQRKMVAEIKRQYNERKMVAEIKRQYKHVTKNEEAQLMHYLRYLDGR
jgi:hypothetical protein